MKLTDFVIFNKINIYMRDFNIIFTIQYLQVPLNLQH